MAKYFACHYGNLDNIGWLQSKNFNEAGRVVHYGELPGCGDIHAAGMKATLNIFNDGSSAADQIGAAGGQFAGYFQSIAGAGWDMIGGEGAGGSVVGTVQNYVIYCNYGGIVSEQQYDMYSSPWNHPASGGKGHVDYIETYNNSGGLVVDSCVACANSAKRNGSKHVGILIGDWMLGVGWQTYANILDQIGGDTILFWGGYGQSSSRCQGLASDLIGHYGAAKWGGGSASAGGGTSSTTTKQGTQTTIHLVKQCPCRKLWLQVKGGDKEATSASEHIEFKVPITGTAGYVDNDQKAIPGMAYTGKLEAWAKDEEGKQWKLFDFWPDVDGSFGFWVGSDKPETRKYSVRFASTEGGAGFTASQLLGGDTTMTLECSDLTPYLNQNVTWTATLKSGSDPLIGMPIKISHYGVQYWDCGSVNTYCYTDINGQRSFTTSYPVAHPALDYTATFEGDSNYKPSTHTLTIAVG